MSSKKEKGQYRYIGLTTHSTTRGKTNIKLSQSPNPNYHGEQYVRPNSALDDTKEFGHKKRGWRFAKRDKKIIRAIKKKR
jgi:hypothetical protein